MVQAIRSIAVSKVSREAMIWMTGSDKLCTYVNQRWLEFTGRRLEAELGYGWTEVVHKEDFERCVKTYSQAVDHRQSYAMEYRARRHDCRNIPVALKMSKAEI